MINSAYLSVTTETQLNDYCQNIINNPEISWIAIDTEFMRTDTYFAELSLVQIEDCLGQTAIIDPLLIEKSSKQTCAKDYLISLIALLSDAHTLKVFHSARQDIEVLYQLANIMPVSIFDTQIACLFLKHGEMAGFARVILAELDVNLAKTQTRTNWYYRPLTEVQINYALDDVRYLAPLYKVCLEQLTIEQISAVSEDCLSMLDAKLYTPDPDKAGHKVKGIKCLRAKQLAIVNILAAWRENFAVRHNKPRKWIMDDEVIIQMAKRPPKTMQALHKLPKLKSSSVNTHGKDWINLIDKVFSMPSKAWPKPATTSLKPTPQEDVLVQLCMSYAQQIAIDFSLNLSSITNRNDLLCIIRQLPTDKPLLYGWRKQLLGDHILSLLDGQSALAVKCKILKLIP